MSTPNTSGDDDSGDEVGSLASWLFQFYPMTLYQGESEGGMTEIRFVPDDASALDSMFTAMSECQVHMPIFKQDPWTRFINSDCQSFFFPNSL